MRRVHRENRWCDVATPVLVLCSRGHDYRTRFDINMSRTTGIVKVLLRGWFLLFHFRYWIAAYAESIGQYNLTVWHSMHYLTCPRLHSFMCYPNSLNVLYTKLCSVSIGLTKHPLAISVRRCIWRQGEIKLCRVLAINQFYLLHYFYAITLI